MCDVGATLDHNVNDRTHPVESRYPRVQPRLKIKLVPKCAFKKCTSNTAHLVHPIKRLRPADITPSRVPSQACTLSRIAWAMCLRVWWVRNCSSGKRWQICSNAMLMFVKVTRSTSSISGCRHTAPLRAGSAVVDAKRFWRWRCRRRRLPRNSAPTTLSAAGIRYEEHRPGPASMMNASIILMTSTLKTDRLGSAPRACERISQPVFWHHSCGRSFSDKRLLSDIEDVALPHLRRRFRAPNHARIPFRFHLANQRPCAKKEFSIVAALPLEDALAAECKLGSAAYSVEGWFASADLRPPVDDRASAAQRPYAIGPRTNTMPRPQSRGSPAS